MTPRSRGFLSFTRLLVLLLAQPGHAAEAPASNGYREPPPAVSELLTASPPPEPLLHTKSRRVALLFRNAVVPLDRLARPFLGLAGFRFDPATGTSDTGPRIDRVEVVDAGMEPGRPPVHWRPAGGAGLAYVRFSPDGRFLSALAVSAGPARMVIFDLALVEQRVIEAPVNAAWGDPCSWIGTQTLLCRLVPADRGDVPTPRTEPRIVEHVGRAAPARTYSNLLDNANEDALFEYHFASELARVGIDGSIHRLAGSRGLIASLLPSPDGSVAVVTRIRPPYSRLLPANRFPRAVELWDLVGGRRLRGAEDSTATASPARSMRGFAWRPTEPGLVGWIEPSGPQGAGERWMALAPPYLGEPREIARSDGSIESIGWTTEGTALFVTRREGGTRTEVFRVTEAGPERIWAGSTEDRYGNPGRALRVHGNRGPWLERGGKLLLASDGLGPEGPEPYLDSVDLRTLARERLFTSPPAAYEPVLGVFDVDPLLLVTSRETETEPPNLYAVRGAERRALRPLQNPYAALTRVERRIVSFRRRDGVALTGTLYLPVRHSADPLPTLVWIYPAEFSEAEYAEQVDVRRYRFHRVKGPSPLCVLPEGYALLLSPTMPIIGSDREANDDYVEQLVANAEAAVEHLVSTGVSDPTRIAIGGRSYGAFSSANLLVHTRLFRTGLLLSGAYNRTLTPFGFQRERRSFWKASDLYARMSPFFWVDSIEEPVLLIHGGSDENAGTPPEQARRFFHALAGNGVSVRYVELPHEGHHYWARESVLHVAAEMLDWLKRTLAPLPE